jgi:hypothetical protein
MLSCLDFTKAANSSWQVVVRMRPLNNKEEAEEATNVVQKLSSNSVLISEQQFTFDAVIGEDASQVLKHILSLSLTLISFSCNSCTHRPCNSYTHKACNSYTNKACNSCCK